MRVTHRDLDRHFAERGALLLCSVTTAAIPSLECSSVTPVTATFVLWCVMLRARSAAALRVRRGLDLLGRPFELRVLFLAGLAASERERRQRDDRERPRTSPKAPLT